MNSENTTSNYASSNDMLYGAHYVTLLSEKVSYENPVGKFSMSYITPNIGSGEFSKTLPKTSTANVVNKDNLGTSKITTSNYINLSVPMHFFYITKLEIKTNTTPCHHGAVGSCNPKIIITRKEYLKGTRFLVVNAGGHVDSPFIVGVE